LDGTDPILFGSLPSASQDPIFAASSLAGPLTRHSIEVQVRRLMEEAKKKTNLMRMYEGWTAWI
jgi:hypothetical protein